MSADFGNEQISIASIVYSPLIENTGKRIPRYTLDRRTCFNEWRLLKAN